MTFDRYPDYVNELIEIHFNNNYEAKKIELGIQKFIDENQRNYDYEIDKVKRVALITVDEYEDYRRLKYLILSVKTIYRENKYGI